ncbi:uncharacterized protein LOC129760859 [Uranotaenia lowii]|uniref:uncharacterized protein LOC129760859 n=1 Tax=Uranotaenia lowii TaxID=190385 RepID=UPI00247AA615|nr:uncharacterized protein LOC129760859 [Uranotaenia lowii]
MNFELGIKIFALLTLFCIQSTVALQCYQCDSIETCNENRPPVTCNEDNVNKTAIMAQTIFPGIFNNITEPVYWCIHARAIKTITGNTEQVLNVKGCIRAQYMGFCNNKPAAGIELDECWSCDSELCNGSRRNGIDQSSVILVVLGGLILLLLQKQ